MVRIARSAVLHRVRATVALLAMSRTKESGLLAVLVIAAIVSGAPPHQCEPEPAPNCSLVFPSILFLNPCQYVCFERLLLPSITVRKHNDGTLCTPAFGFLGIGTCHNGTCVQQPTHGSPTVQPVTHPPTRGTFRPRQMTPAEHSRPSSLATASVGRTDHSTATIAKRTGAALPTTRRMP